MSPPSSLLRNPAATDATPAKVLADILAAVDAAAADRWAHRLIARFGSPAAALAAPLPRLDEVLDDARATALIAACRRALLWSLREPIAARPLLATRDALLNYARQSMAFDGEETLRAFFVNGRRELIAEEEVARGTPSMLMVEPRQILVRALALAATGVILVHNHPSGDPAPSAADRRFTQRLAAGGACIGVTLHDHLVVARGGARTIEVVALPLD